MILALMWKPLCAELMHQNLHSTGCTILLSSKLPKTLRNQWKSVAILYHSMPCVCVFMCVCVCVRLYVNICVHSVFSISMTTSISTWLWQPHMLIGRERGNRWLVELSSVISAGCIFVTRTQTHTFKTRTHTHTDLSVPSTYTPTNCSKAQTKGTSKAHTHSDLRRDVVC